MTKNYLKQYLQEGGEMMPQEEVPVENESAEQQPDIKGMIEQYMQEPSPELQQEIIMLIAQMMGIGEQAPQSAPQQGETPQFKKGGKISKLSKTPATDLMKKGVFAKKPSLK